jgi:hypothetical protein
VVNFTPRPLYPWQRNMVAIDWKLGGLYSRSELFGGQKSLVLTGIFVTILFQIHSLQNFHACCTASTSLFREQSPTLRGNPWEHHSYLIRRVGQMDTLPSSQSLTAVRLVVSEKRRYLHWSASVTCEWSSVSRTLR